MAEKRLNKSLVVGLVVGLMVVLTVGLIVLLTIYRGSERGGAAYVRQAIEAYNAGNYEIAMKAYGNAFRRTRDPNWLVAQGQAAKDLGQAADALKCWDHAVTEDPGLIAAHEARVKMRLELAAVYGTFAQSAALRGVAESLLKQKPDNALGHLAMGLALTGLAQEDPNNMTNGIAMIEKAFKLAPADKDIGKSLANVYEITSHNKQNEKKEKEAAEYRNKADDVYRAMIKADPESDAAYLAYAEFLTRRLRADLLITASQQRKYDPAKKEAALKQIEENLLLAQKKQPNSPTLGMQWAQYWDIAGDQQKVIAAYEETIKRSPDFLDAYMELALRRQRQQQPDEALKVLAAGLARPVDRSGYMGDINKGKRFRMLLLEAEINLEQAAASPDKRASYIAKAEEAFNQAVAERGGEHWLARRVEGQIREEQGRLQEAETAYESADRALPWDGPNRFQKIQTRLRLAQLYRNRNAPGKAMEMLDSVLEYNRMNRAARLMKARLFLQIGKPQEAVDEAIQVLTAAKELGDDNPIIRDARLVAMEGYRRLGKVESLKELQPLVGGDTPADKVRNAVIYQAQKDNVKAAAAFKEALKDDPANPQFLQPAIQFFMSIKQRDEAVKLVQAALAKKPDDVSLKRVELWLDEDFEKLDPKERDAREVAIIEKLSDPVQRETALYVFYYQRNNMPKAMEHLEAARKLKPEDVALLDREFALALQLRDWARAEKCLEQMVKKDADGTGGRLYKGQVLCAKALAEQQEAERLQSKDLAKARGHSDKAKDLYGQAAKQLRESIGIDENSSVAHQWLGVAEEGLGHFVEARDAYTVAVRLDPTNASAHKALARLGMLYGNVADTDVHLKEAIRLAPKDAQGIPTDEWLRLQVENEQEQKDPRQAITRREEIRKKKPQDVGNLMRLALLYERTGEKDKGEKCIQDALQAEPKNINLIWYASRYYSQAKQYDKGERLLRDYVKQAEGDEKGRAQALVARHFALKFNDLRAARASVEEIFKAQQAADQAFRLAVSLGASPQVYWDAAAFCLSTGRAQGAVTWLREALENIKDKSYEAQMRQRLIRILLANRPVPPETTTEVAEYCKRFPDDPMGFLFRGELSAAQGKLTEAIEEHTAYLDQIGREAKSARRDARLRTGYLLRGQMYLRKARETFSNRKDLVQLAIRDLNLAKGSEGEGVSNTRARIALSQAYELAGQPAEAVRELTSVLAKDPKASDAAMELVGFYGRNKRWAEQEELIRRQIALFPDESYWYVVLGGQLDAQGKSGDAVAPLRKACEVLGYRVVPDDGSARAMALLLRALGKSGLDKDVIDIVTTKIPKESVVGEIQMYYASALAKTGKTDQALKEFRNVLASTRSLDDYSRAARQMGEAFGLKRAIDIVRKDLAKNPDKTEAGPLLLATLLAYDNQKEEASTLAGQAVAAASDPLRKALCLASQGTFLYELGKREEAAASYTEALRHNNNDLTALNNLAFILADDLKRPKDALPYAQQAQRLSPNDARVLDTLGWCLFLAGKSQDALGVLGEAIDREPTLLDPRLHMAQVYAKDGRKSEAKGAIDAASKIATESGDEAAKSRVAKLMKDLGI